jgi:hypothetical protein
MQYQHTEELFLFYMNTEDISTLSNP